VTRLTVDGTRLSANTGCLLASWPVPDPHAQAALCAPVQMDIPGAHFRAGPGGLAPMGAYPVHPPGPTRFPLRALRAVAYPGVLQAGACFLTTEYAALPVTRVVCREPPEPPDRRSFGSLDPDGSPPGGLGCPSPGRSGGPGAIPGRRKGPIDSTRDGPGNATIECAQQHGDCGCPL
jgi:hypothetical protein